MEVEEAPWIGRKFTWFRPNGIARSKLDRFLVSPKWLTKWPGSIQHPLDRNFFGHCLVLLRSKVVDWGPKPFRVQDCWLLNKSFKSIVKECWLSQQQSGWGGFVLKEKIKKLKERLKTWNRDRFGDTLKKYKKIEGELNQLEVNLADRPLSPQQMIIRKQLQEDLWIAAQSHESLLRQFDNCGRARRGSRVRFPKEERCAESPPTFICGKLRKNRRKPVKKNIPSSGVIFTFEEGISTSHVCLKGQHPIF